MFWRVAWHPRCNDLSRGIALRALRIVRVVLGTAVAAALAATLVLESLYWAMLPKPLPTPAMEPLPPLVRDVLWVEFGGRPVRGSWPYFPFTVSWLLPHDSAREALLSRIALLHVSAIRDHGRLARGNEFSGHLREAAVATWISRHWTADEAVDTYGANVWMGGDRVGLRAGASYLFGRSLDRLSAAQVALLVGLTRSPTSYDPACHPDRARAARDLLLHRLADADVLAAQEVERALDEPVETIASCEQAAQGLWPGDRTSL
jgi:hypothetical protein